MYIYLFFHLVEPCGFQVCSVPNKDDDSHEPVMNDYEVDLDSASDSGSYLECQNDESKESLPDLAAKFLLKIKHENVLNQKTVHNIAHSTCALISATVAHLKRGIEECLKEADVDADELPGLNDVFAETEDLCKATRRTATTVSFDKLLEDGLIPYVVRLHFYSALCLCCTYVHMHTYIYIHYIYTYHTIYQTYIHIHVYIIKHTYHTIYPTYIHHYRI